jgi:hypothetical protein
MYAQEFCRIEPHLELIHAEVHEIAATSRMHGDVVVTVPFAVVRMVKRPDVSLMATSAASSRKMLTPATGAPFVAFTTPRMAWDVDV